MAMNGTGMQKTRKMARGSEFLILESRTGKCGEEQASPIGLYRSEMENQEPGVRVVQVVCGSLRDQALRSTEVNWVVFTPSQT